jgi:hypothetical protein
VRLPGAIASRAWLNPRDLHKRNVEAVGSNPITSTIWPGQRASGAIPRCGHEPRRSGSRDLVPEGGVQIGSQRAQSRCLKPVRVQSPTNLPASTDCLRCYIEGLNGCIERTWCVASARNGDQHHQTPPWRLGCTHPLPTPLVRPTYQAGARTARWPKLARPKAKASDPAASGSFRTTVPCRPHRSSRSGNPCQRLSRAR